MRARAPRVEFQVTSENKGGALEIGPNHSDHAGWITRLDDAFGTASGCFVKSQLVLLLNIAGDGKGGYDRSKINGIIAAIEGAKPENEMQAILCVQMPVTNDLAIQAAARARSVDTIERFDSAGNMAVKLLRTFVGQSEALAKLQRGGEQIIKIVNVHSGGQAIVGNVVGAAKGSNGTNGANSDSAAGEAGEGSKMKTQTNPMQRQSCQPPALGHCRKCGAKTRAGTPCRSPAVKAKARCRMHGGAADGNAPKGKRNGAYSQGRFTTEAIAERRKISGWLATARGFLDSLE